MTDSLEQHHLNSSNEPQCRFFVQRKKRLCRMTVKPGRMYCGEHEPQPKAADGQDDTRIPCPNDPKHTCYVSKLEKHLLICNARPKEQPPYIVHNFNVPADTEVCERKPLSQLSKETVLSVIEKVNTLYEKHVKGQITTEPERPIHSTVLEEFSESDRAQSSLRHLRQVSSLLWLTENEGLVKDQTCYVELGAGKGVVSYYAWQAWCTSAARGSCALLVDRASLRHKRDNKLRRAAGRVRADLAHLALLRVPAARHCAAVVGLAKHLCGVATDYALRCVCAAAARGVVLATCCHHRCHQPHYRGAEYLRELGITGDDLNVMLGIVSWATCGDGRSRERRNEPDRSDGGRGPDDSEHRPDDINHRPDRGAPGPDNGEHGPDNGEHGPDNGEHGPDNGEHGPDTEKPVHERLVLTQEYREEVGRRAKHLIDWGRVLYLRNNGFDARLCYYVPASVSLENVCIVAKRPPRDELPGTI